MSPELDASLRTAAKRLGTDISRLVETLLRENAVVADQIATDRRAPTTKKGRPVEKILALAEVAKEQWEQRLRSGQVKLIGR